MNESFILRIDILTLHPGMFAPLEHSMLKRAQDSGILEIHVHDIRDYGLGRYKQVDDTPYGGGSGMVLRVDVIDKCLESIPKNETHVLLMDPVGKPFEHDDALRLSQKNHLVFICGHYEGIDARVRNNLIDESMSIGDFVLTGGELPAMVIIDALARQIKGVLGNEGSLENESFSGGLLEAPQYTRPRDYRGWDVPDVLLGGHHAKIKSWRKEQSLSLTKANRPDLFKKSFDTGDDSE
jgi:tRNA (guanine37-N1)-methyltransferase